MDVGAIQVLPVLDGSARFDAAKMFADLSPLPGLGTSEEDWLPHQDLLDDDGRLELAFGAYVVRSGERIMLVDAGMGPRPQMPGSGGGLLDSLAAYGIAAGDVTDVVYTHLHGDHIGWASDEGEVVFVNAVHRCHRLDWEHFIGTDETGHREADAGRAAARALRCRRDPRTGRRRSPRAGSHSREACSWCCRRARTARCWSATWCTARSSSSTTSGARWPTSIRCWHARRASRSHASSRGATCPIGAAHFPGLEFGRLLTGEGRRMWSVG